MSATVFTLQLECLAVDVGNGYDTVTLQATDQATSPTFNTRKNPFTLSIQVATPSGFIVGNTYTLTSSG